MAAAASLLELQLTVTASGEVRAGLVVLLPGSSSSSSEVSPPCALLVDRGGTAPAAVGLVYDAVMQLHLREDHPEHPSRVIELQRRLEAAGLLQRCVHLTPKLASDEELLRAHSRAHIAKVDGLFLAGVDKQGQPAERHGDTILITSDIFCNRHTATAARSAAGCSIRAVESVLSGECGSAFAVVRPPGHHAESEELMGFCFFNNVSVAAQAALQHPGVQRVAIVDWDIHHGNGTQQIFAGDDRVLFVSLHRRDGDFYPAGCGFATEVGSGKGMGYTVNVPWSSRGVGDADYLAALDLVLGPILTQFAPQLLLISAGFDAAEGDFLGRCCVSPAGFAAMTQRLRRAVPGGRVVGVLEGGYVPGIVGECTCAVMQVLLGDEPPPLPRPAAFSLHRCTRAVLGKVDEIQRQHWSLLAAQPPFSTAFAAYNSSLKLQGLSLSTPRGSSHSTRGAVRAAAAAAAAASSPPAAAAEEAATDSLSLTSRAPTLRGRRPAAASSSTGRGQQPLPPSAAAAATRGRSSRRSSRAVAAAAPAPGASSEQQTQQAAAAGSDAGAADSGAPPPSVAPGAAAAASAADGQAAPQRLPGRKILKIKLKLGAVPAAPPPLAAGPVAPPAAPTPAGAAVAAPPAAASGQEQQQQQQPAVQEQPSVATQPAAAGAPGGFKDGEGASDTSAAAAAAAAAAGSSALELEAASGDEPVGALIAHLTGLSLAPPTGNMSTAVAAVAATAAVGSEEQFTGSPAATLVGTESPAVPAVTADSAAAGATLAAAGPPPSPPAAVKPAPGATAAAAWHSSCDVEEPRTPTAAAAVAATSAAVAAAAWPFAAAAEPGGSQAAQLAELMKSLSLASPLVQQQAVPSAGLAGCAVAADASSGDQQPAEPRQWVMAAAAVALPDD